MVVRNFGPAFWLSALEVRIFSFLLPTEACQNYKCRNENIFSSCIFSNFGATCWIS